MSELVPVEVRGAQEVLPPVAEAFLQRSPFTSAKPVLLNMPEGMTLQGYADAALLELPAAYAPHLHLFIGENEVPRAMWRMVTPKPGNVVTIRVLPAGGDGGKNILRAVIMIAVVVAATYFLGPAGIGLAAAVGGGAFGAVVTALAVAAIAFTAQLALNALIPPPKQPGAGEHRDFLTGGQNAFDPYGSIPRLFGRHRVYPKLAAHPYTEIVGKKHYLRLLLMVGYGPIKLSDIRIGNTPLSAYVGVEYEVHEGGPDGWSGNAPITLYNKQVSENQFSITMNDYGAGGIQTTAAGVTEISVDIVFPQGLIGFNKKGEHQRRAVEFKVEYRPAGSNGGWTQADWIADPDNPVQHGNGYLHAEETTQEQVLISGRWRVPKGTYDVHVERRTAMGEQTVGGTNEIDRAVWTTLRSISDASPINMEGLCLLAIRIRASDQLNGVVQNVNCLAEAYLPVTADGTNWTYQLTRSPAWAYADVLRRRGREALLADTRIDVPAIMAWAAACAVAPANDPSGQAWTYDGPIEGGGVFDAARQIAAVGRATFAIRDGRFSVTRDLVQPTPVQHFTPRNSWSYSAVRTYVDLPHALKVRFLNEDKDYAPDEVYVYADGYSAANATVFDTLDMPGTTSPKMAWREGRYHLAVGYARQEEHTISVDVESLRCTTGDRVQLAHDVILVGQAWGRITHTHVEPGHGINEYYFDQDVTFEAGKTYQLRIRHKDGTSSVRAVIPFTTGPSTGTFSYCGPVAYDITPVEPDDLFMFGETGLESAPMVVKRIEAGEDLSAKLSLVAYNPAIQNADTGPIPAFASYLSNPVAPQQRRPPKPFMALRADNTAVDIQSDGTVTPRIAVDLRPGGSSLVTIAGWEVQYRVVGDDQWLAAGPGAYPVEKSTIFISAIRASQDYDVRARAVSAYGEASDWVVASVLASGWTLPPVDPTPLPLVRLLTGVGVRWVDPTDINYAATAVLVGENISLPGNAIEAGRTAGGAFDVTLALGVTRHFWLKSYDTTGNPSALVYCGSAQADPTLYNIASDGVLAKGAEKADALQRYTALANDHNALTARYHTLGDPTDITPAYSAAQAAVLALTTYLNTLTPSWSDTNTDTPVDRATWDQKWNAASAAVSTFRAAITGRKGDTGAAGAPGSSAYTMILSNENATLPADHAGNVTSYAEGATKVQVFYGGTDVTSSFGYTYDEPSRQNPQGLSVTGTYPNFQISDGFDANEETASFIFKLTGTGANAGVMLEKRMSLSKSKAALDGTSPPLITMTATSNVAKFDKDGVYVGGAIKFTALHQNISGGNYAFKTIRLSDGVLLASDIADGFGASGDGYYTGSGGDHLVMTALAVRDYITYHGPFQVVAYSDGFAVSDAITILPIRDGATGTAGTNGINGGPGQDGRTTYFHTAFADSPQGTIRFTSGAPEDRTYIGTYTDFTEADSQNPALYSWSPYRGPSFGMVARGNAAVSGSSIIKEGGVQDWDSDAFSAISYTNGAIATARAGQTNANVMFGLNTDPASDQGFSSLDFAWHFTADNHVYIYENGQGVQDCFQGIGLGYTFSVEYDGRYVRYFCHNGTAKNIYRTVDIGPGYTFFFDSSIWSPSARLDGVDFRSGPTRSGNGITLVPDTVNTQIAGNSIRTGPDSGGWGLAHAHSLEAYSLGAVASWTIPPDDGLQSPHACNTMAGLTTDPTASNSYEHIDFAIHRNDSGGIGLYSNGSPVGPGVAAVDPNSTTRCRVHYDGKAAVRFFVNDQLVYTMPQGVFTAPLYFAAALASDNARLEDVVLAAAGAFGVDGTNGTNGLNGGPGADARLLTISASATSLKLNADGSIPTGTPDFVFTANRQNYAGAITWSYVPGHGLNGGEVVSGDTLTVPAARMRDILNYDAANGVGPQVQVRVAGGGLAFTTTVNLVIDGTNGSNGSNGAPGQNAIDISAAATKQTARYDKTGAYVGGPITFTTNRKNTTSTPVFRGEGFDGASLFEADAAYMAANYGPNFTSTGPDNLTLSPSYINAASSYGGGFTIIAKVDGYQAKVSVGRIYDGIDGSNGSNGAPGAPGANGTTPYVHFAYADSADGAVNFTTGDAQGRLYVGVLIDNVVADSPAYTDYMWTRLRGTDGTNGSNGINGGPGQDGKNTFVHVAYANSADGSVSFHVSDPTGRAYVGIRVDFVEADSTSYGDYTWSLIKGADGANGNPGAPGEPAYSVDVSPRIITIAADYTGTTKGGQLPRTFKVTIMRGSTDVTAAAALGVSYSDGIHVASLNGSGQGTVDIIDSGGYIEVSATHAGTTLPVQRIQVVRQVDAPPPQSQTSASTSGEASVGASLTIISDTLVLKANGSGQINVNGGATYTADGSATGINRYTGALSFAYSAVGGSFSYTGSGGSSTQAVTPKDGTGDPTEGQASYSTTLTGLTPGATYQVALAITRTVGNAGAYVQSNLAVSQ